MKSLVVFEWVFAENPEGMDNCTGQGCGWLGIGNEDVDFT